MMRGCVGYCWQAPFGSAFSGAAFLMEPQFPLGDWRWVVITTVAAVLAWWLWYTDPQRKAEPDSPAAQSKDPPKEKSDAQEMVDMLIEHAALYALTFLPFIVIGALVAFGALVVHIVRSVGE